MTNTSHSIFLDSYKTSSRPYQTTTNHIEINIWPEFLDIKDADGEFIYVWAYHVNIKNLAEASIKLLTRHFKIIDENGKMIEVNGDGVVGEQPTIKANQHFQYSSGIHLKAPSGIMSGYYTMQNKESDEIFIAKLPSFSLHVPSDNETKN